jgi:hypothetical protein
MALEAVKRFDDYFYFEIIDQLSPEVIDEAKETFEHYRSSGVIKAECYDASDWYILDGVHSPQRIRFDFDEVAFQRVCHQKLGVTLDEYRTAMRVALMAAMGRVVALTLGALCREMRRLAVELDTFFDHLNPEHAEYYVNFLELLPGNTAWKTTLIKRLETEVVRAGNARAKKARELSYAESYFLFDNYLNKFWSGASSDEKLLYFPVFFWWKVTSILPLRPTECVVTPRKCLRIGDDGKNYLTVRRTLQKRVYKAISYDLEKDYVKKEYPISKEIADVIAWYISETEKEYVSAEDVLFSKRTQVRLSGAKSYRDQFYYGNLKSCLDRFYQEILVAKYGLRVRNEAVKTMRLEKGEIDQLQLGDTRHLAMISIMASGHSRSICRELAGHLDPDISFNYYGNLKTFLHLLSFEKARVETGDFERSSLLAVPASICVEDGLCTSKKTVAGDFTHCCQAVDQYGRPGTCRMCKYFVVPAGDRLEHYAKAAEDDLDQTFLLFRHTLRNVQSGLDVPETTESMILRMRACAENYYRYLYQQKKAGGM